MSARTTRVLIGASLTLLMMTMPFGTVSGAYHGVTKLTSPADGATGVALTSELTWVGPPGAKYFMIEIFTPSNGWSRTFYTANPSIFFTLDPGITWSWHVASSPNKVRNYGPWSETWTFTTTSGGGYYGVATDPVPANGATGIALTSVLSWTAPQDANHYMIEIFTPSNGRSATFDTPTPSITFTLDPGITWSWHVASSPDYGGTYGPWSETWTFTTTI